MKIKITFIFLLAMMTAASYSNERRFTYLYQSGVLGKGNKELEVSTTIRLGRNIPFYSAMDNRVEFEAGLTNKLQSAFYLNFKSESIDDGTGKISSSKIDGISSEWKYQVSDLATSSLGFALYGELALGTDEVGFEGKLIFDKKIKKTLLALNLVAEHVWGLSAGKPEKVLNLESNFGLSYAASSSFAFGFELFNRNEMIEGELTNSLINGGPVFSYSAPTFWATLTVLPQIAAFKNKTGDSRLNLSEFEKLETRLIFSFRL